MQTVKFIYWKSVLPHPLKDKTIDSTVWSKDLVFEQGSHYLVTAPSGKGKSTFIHALYGLRKDFDGQVLFGESSTADISIDQLLEIRRHEFAIVFQDLRLFDNISAIDNLNIHQDAAFTQKQVEALAKPLGMESLLNQKTHTLSYGQQQRIAIIRALCRPFKWLLLDEPFSHLDAENEAIAWDLIQKIAKKNEASIILTCLDGPPSDTAWSKVHRL